MAPPVEKNFFCSLPNPLRKKKKFWFKRGGLEKNLIILFLILPHPIFVKQMFSNDQIVFKFYF